MPDNKISLIIPEKNEEDTLPVLLESIMAQTKRPDEIVVTDAGSHDRSIAIIESYIEKGYPIRLLKAGAAYPGKARNLAIEASSYDLIAMTDAGIGLDKEWLKELMRPIEEDAATDVVYGNYEPITDTFFKKCLAIAFVKAPDIINGKVMRSHFIASCLIKKSAWKAIGGFPDFRAAEDRIFMEKVDKGGFKIKLAPDAKVFWEIPSDLKQVFRRFSTFSMHDICAGRFADWQKPVITMYAIGAVIAILGISLSPLWFLLLFLGIFFRSMGIIIDKSKGKRLREKLDIRVFFMVTILILWIDIAMFWGMVKYLWLIIKRA